MKIICTKEEFAEMLEVCCDKVKGGNCKACPLYSACGGDNVKRNDDVSDLPREPPFRVNGFQAQCLIENDIIRAVWLAHEEVHCVAVQERFLQSHPVVCFTCRHTQPGLA